jgi:hypothetical protein
MESLSNIYGNISQICHPKNKTYIYAQLGELLHSIAIEPALKHEVICGSKPTGEKHEEDEITVEQ